MEMLVRTASWMARNPQQLCSPIVQSSGCRAMSNRPNTKKHPHAHWDRMKLLEMTKVKAAEPFPTTEHLWKDCPKKMEVLQKRLSDLPNDLEILYGQQCRQYFDQSKMIGILHVNSIKTRPQRKAWQDARRLGMDLVKYNKKICRYVLRNSKWENVLPLVEDAVVETPFVFSQELNLTNLLEYEKKVAEFVLLGAIVENRILDRAQIVQFEKVPSIQALHGELSSILQTPAMKMRSLLNSNQQTLARNIDQLIKDRTEKGE